MVNLSYLVTVGQLRFIQSRYEHPGYLNPDLLVSDFLPIAERLGGVLRGLFLLSKMRSNPFYNYVISRTYYYDEIFVRSMYDQLEYIVNIGCGTDTRPYRFAHLLRQKGVRVLECDQEAAISRKSMLARRRWPTDHVDYMAIDLNEEGCPQFEAWLSARRNVPILVMLEGVSMYIKQGTFEALLRLLGRELAPGSIVAYDFKIAGVNDSFGRPSETEQPFRLPSDPEDLAAYHKPFGLRLVHSELSSELTQRLLPSDLTARRPSFHEDCLLRLTVAPR